MENSFKNIIGQSKSILILLPTKPFFDQVASALSLFLALKEDKDVSVYASSPVTVEFNRLIGVNKITTELGNKNLVIRFTDYKATDIERVSYDIENSQFRLTVIPKPRITPPMKEQIDLSYSGVAADTVVVIGGANETHFPALSTKDLSGANIVHIGTKDISLSTNKNYVSFSRPASSVSEIAADLIREAKGNFDSDIATNLLMGIEEATDNLANPSVTADTFLVVAELMRAGGKRFSAQNIPSRRDFPVGAVPGDFTGTQRPLRHVQNPRPFVPKAAVASNQRDNQNQQPGSGAGKDQESGDAPSDWLQPKIYKGTSVS